LAATGCAEDRTLYRVACRRGTRLIHASGARHLAGTISECGTNLRQLWQKVNGLLHPPQPIVHMGDGWTQSLSDSFALKVKNIKLRTSVLASQLRPTLPCVREVPPAVMTCLRPVTLSEVLLLLSKMAARSS